MSALPRRLRLTRHVLPAVALLGALAPVTGAAAPSRALPSATRAASAAEDWPTFLHDNARSAASGDSTLSAANAASLTKRWSYATGGSIVDSAAVVAGVVYVGSWDGYEYALNASTGALIWRTNLGTTTDANCSYPTTAGVTSAATVVNGVVYVGGGGPNWYALSATTGAVLWSVPTGDNSPAAGHYNWSSPLIYDGNAYIGIASNCDNPLVQGELLQVSLSSHTVTNVAKFAPDGQQGGGVWTSPTVDAATNTIFVSTGTINQYTQPYAQAIVAVDATTMAVKDHWQLPFEAETYDSDWGTTPTLTTDSAGRQLLTVANKNGILYTFNRNDLAAGPLWQYQLAPGGECPTCGDGTISSGAFVNSITVTGPSGTYTGPVVFYADGYTLVNGAGYQGAVRAFNPANGAMLWAHYTSGPILGALAFDNGLIVEGQGDTLEVLDASTGNSLYDYLFTQPVYTAPAISGGQVFIGTNDNSEYAFGLPASVTTPPADPNCPAGYTCQDIGNPQSKGSEVVNGDGSVSVSGAGPGVRHGSVDQMRLVTKPVTGDFQVSVDDLRATGGTINGYIAPQVGIMVRESNDPGAPFYAALQDPTYPAENETVANLIVFYRATWGAAPAELTQEFPAGFPRSFMVQRRGDSFQTLISSNGGTSYWLIPGTMKDVVMPTTLMAGMGVGSGASNSLTTVTYTSLTTSSPPTNNYGFLATAHACPAGWTCRGVDDPNPPGDQVLSNGAWTLSGAGTGITSGAWQMYGDSDQFHYVYQSVANDQTLVARFTGFSGSSPPSKAQAGIMMRANTSPTSPYYAILLSPSGGGMVQWRAHPNAVSRTGFIPEASLTAPVYLRISRYTDTRFTPPVVSYSAATSPDGTTWTDVVGSTAVIDMGGGAAGPTLMGMAATAFAERTQVPAGFTNVSITPTTTVPPGVCPDGMTCADVGNGHVPGNQTDVNHVFTVQASGDLWDVYDQFRYLSQPMTGDGTVSARVVSMQNGGEWQKAGVMIRSDAAGAGDPEAPYYAALITPKHGIAVQWRPAEGAASQQDNVPGTPAMFTAPIYLMVSRYTDSAHGGTVYYTAYYSTDNVTWTIVPGSTTPLTIPLDSTGGMTAGIAATSYSSGLATATVDNFAQLGSAPPPPGLCPSAWQCADIGGALPYGSQDVSDGAWTVYAGGSDLWNTSDQFHLASQSLAADGTVSAHVTAESGGGGWAKGGVIMRMTADPASPYYGLFVTPANGVVVQWRATAGATTGQVAVPGSTPAYLMVDRWTTTAGGTSTTYYQALTSPDGTTWTAVPGSLMTVPGLSGTLLAGLATDSWYQGTAATWSIDSVAVTAQELQPQGACANGWQCTDIGGATPAGAQSANGSSWTVQGGGSDIWNTSDQFRLIDQPQSGNATVTAHVAAQTNTSAWAKAGVMVRASTDPGDVYYATLVTPANGVVVQWRATAGAATNQLAVAGAPTYVRVSRWTDASGATPVTYLTASTSTDGVTWTAVPGSTVAMTLPATTLDGLAVSSHNNAALSTVSFTGVAVSASSSAPPGICPGNWSCADIGGATPAGAQNDNAGTWTIQGGGIDIWNASDQFRFVWQSLAADGTVSARVSAQAATNAWAKAGVMVRASQDPGAAEYSVLLTPANGVLVQCRSAQGATSTIVASLPPGPASLFLRITRAGQSFGAATSPDGVTWTAIPGSSITLANLSGSLLAGLAVTSHDSTTLGAATFDSVSA